jgi:hypothetical protein
LRIIHVLYGANNYNNYICFDKNNIIVTPWGNGTYKCLENNKVNAIWNGYDHILSFDDTLTRFDWTSNKNNSGSEVLLERMPLISYLNLNNFHTGSEFKNLAMDLLGFENLLSKDQLQSSLEWVRLNLIAEMTR